ncbi:MAG: Gfo/Idh/MocA family protein [Candidatus Nanopelagicales bacterium]
MTAVRWGFLGAGFVASRGVAPVVHQAESAVLQVVAARDVERARALEPQRAVASYDEVLAADDVDAVYISLPNDAHLRWVLAAMEAGKHVLCEKPLALDAREVEQMTAAAEKAGVLLVEAAWNRWHPRTHRVAELLAGVDGGFDVRAWFTFSGVPADNYRLDPARGGGALLDVGVYATAAALMALGPDPLVVSVDRENGPTGVDLTTSAQLRSAQGTATVLGSFVQPESQGWTLSAPGLSLDLPHPAFTAWREAASLRVVADGVERVEEFAACDPYLLMVESVSRRIRGEDAWVLPLSTSLSVARTIEAIARTEEEP